MDISILILLIIFMNVFVFGKPFQEDDADHEIINRKNDFLTRHSMLGSDCIDS